MAVKISHARNRRGSDFEEKSKYVDTDNWLSRLVNNPEMTDKLDTAGTIIKGAFYAPGSVVDGAVEQYEESFYQNLHLMWEEERENFNYLFMVSFMNEPNVVANLTESAIRDIRNGDFKKAARKLGAVTRSIIFCNVLKSLIYAMRDDDEDETYIEKYMQALVSNVIGDFTGFNYIPLSGIFGPSVGDTMWSGRTRPFSTTLF